MITLKTEAQISAMREAGALLHKVLIALKARIAPGVTTLELDALAEQMIRDAGAIALLQGLRRLPRHHLRLAGRPCGARHPERSAASGRANPLGGLRRHLKRLAIRQRVYRIRRRSTQEDAAT